MNSFELDVIRGLSSRPRSLPPKYFYDQRGARLFEEICQQPEYTLTRAELEILEAADPGVIARLGPEGVLIEYGSGSCLKTRALLSHAPDGMAYVPIDVSEEQLRDSARRIAAEFPRLQVLPLAADFTREVRLPGGLGSPARRRMVYFPGSTIGNLDRAEAVGLLRLTRSLTGPKGRLLLGADLLKPPRLIEAAYNDARGRTAAFNLNLLERINRELGADFDPGGFRHRAFFNPGQSRVEMHLVSLRGQEVTVAERRFRFRAGDSIHTESSYKYSPNSLAGLAREAGYSVRQSRFDRAGGFGMFLLEAD